MWSDEHFFSLADTRYIRKETKDYVPKLIAAALIAQAARAVYGFPAPAPAEPFPLDSIVVPDMTGLDVIAELAGVPPRVIRELNPHYLRAGDAAADRRRGPAAGRHGGRVNEGLRRAAGHVSGSRSASTSSPRARPRAASRKRMASSLAALREANPEIKSKPPRPGQRLVIPTGAAARWSESDAERRATGSARLTRSRRGNAGRIASRYRVSVSQSPDLERSRHRNSIRGGPETPGGRSRRRRPAGDEDGPAAGRVSPSARQTVPRPARPTSCARAKR